VPDCWSENKWRQKDTDARWTKKGDKSYYDYKNHVNVENAHKLVRGYAVTDASATEKPPVLGILQRSGEVAIRLLDNVQQAMIKPLILHIVAPGTLIYTDEYSIYDRLEAWGYQHKTVNHSAVEYARDENGDGFCAVHSNTIEGFWSLLRSWLRPHRGISQAKLPLYLSFFEFVHNAKKRGKKLLSSLLSVLVNKIQKTI